MKLMKMFIAFMALGFAFASWGGVIYLEDGATLEIGAADTVKNVATNRYWFKGSGTIKLTGELAEGALFTFSPVILATNGNITVDATALGTCRGIRWHNHVRVDGALTVKGTDYIEFGTTATNVQYNDTNLTSFWCDPQFVTAEGAVLAEPAGIVFTNAVTLMVKPTCPWSIGQGCWFWPYVDNTLGQAGETLAITNYNLGIINEKSIAADTVKLGSGCKISFRTCTVGWESQQKDPGNFWKWGGTGRTLPCNVVLDGGTLYTCSTPDITFGGDITGTGKVLLGNAKGGVIFAGKVDFTGDLLSYNTGGIIVTGEAIANTVNFKKTSASAIAFHPEGYGSTVTTGSVGGLMGSAAIMNVLNVYDYQSLSVGTIAGTFAITDGVQNATVTIDTLAADAKLVVADGIAVTIKTADASSSVVLTNLNGTGHWIINGANAQTRTALTLVPDPAVEAPRLTLGGALDVTGIPANLAALTIATDADVVGTFPPRVPVTSKGGTWQSKGWQSKVALWCDASLTNTFTYVKDRCPTWKFKDESEEKAHIFWWHDWRSDHQDYAFAISRFKETDGTLTNYPAVYPNVISAGGPNDRAYLKCSSGSQTRMGVLNPTNALNVSRGNKKEYDKIPSQYAIVIARNISKDYGSAVLSSYDASLQATKRGYDGNILSNSTLQVYQNGTAVDGTATTWGHSIWAIYSFTTEGAEVNGLACADDPNSSKQGGGFDYAEVMVFAELPTADERQQIEEYLSAKWGIAVAHTNTLAEQTLMGWGATTLTGGTYVNGAFTGTVNLNGQRLQITEGHYPLTAAEIPTAERQVWFDPSVAGTFVMSDDPAKPEEIAAAYTRDNAGNLVMEGSGFYLQSAYSQSAFDTDSGDTAISNRRPHVVTGTRGGMATTWVDFANLYDDGFSNNFQFRALPWSAPLADYTQGDWKNVVYKTAFLVIDSSRGGGLPLCNWIGGTGGDIVIRGYAEKSKDINYTPAVTDPIWNPFCTDIIKNGRTWLDDNEINGTTTGFNGRPEVMSFEAAQAGALNNVSYTYSKALACINVGKNLNQEYMGEVLLYNTNLTDAVRADIQAYLMLKWLGKVPSGYHDFRSLTVTGAGEVLAPSFKALPQTDANFTGTIAVTEAEQTFTFAANATVAHEAFTTSSTVALADNVTINLAFATAPTTGKMYRLFTANVLGAPTFTLGTVTGCTRLNRLRLVWDGQTLCATIPPRGISISFR